ncbi:U6 snRNA-associated Sm-like protein LSm7 [Aulographum hederae CBS 113979]|uniref:U6 snRNA-associated Sm-like protein LSm7 n=1 Tax=Aulographum hederae CBS 113979 TaxID=1176131 RepID=A0A6G1GSV8_9PEZI|nr:U6 snRNA-associated Sm-like protein LSm7 [Aulographum hederae CBS 113979]
MSERANFRGARGGRGGRGGARGGAQGGAVEKPKKENILDLSKYMDQEIAVKFNQGREVTGVLKGFDGLMNLVLDDVKELSSDGMGGTTTRSLGLIVARGTLIVLVSPVDGTESIPNPWGDDDEEVLEE